jgi:hypothetical protein
MFLTYLQNVALSEQGYFYVAANGNITFTDRVSASFAYCFSNLSAIKQESILPYTGLVRFCMGKSSFTTKLLHRLRVAQIRPLMMLLRKLSTVFLL